MGGDARFMSMALDEAARGLGKTSPNPVVGCVIVKKGRVVAKGFHHHYGGHHAEVDALRKAGARARGAVMYVTLEPCAHFGKTPPCADAVIAAGIEKVVVAMQDPNPLTDGASIRKLRSSGIKVVVGVEEKRARALNAPFIKYIRQGMPYVVVKTAQTMDGKVGTRSGSIRWITSAATRRKAKLRRDMFDAIVVGVNTILADDPLLDAAHKCLNKVVVDSTLKASPGARIFSGNGQVIMAATPKASLVKMAAFAARGAVVMPVPAKAGKVDLEVLFKRLAEKGLIRILVEGGPALAAAVIKAGLADRMHIYIAPRVIGPAVPDALAGLDVAGLMARDKLEIVLVERTGKDIFIEADYVHRDC